MGQPLATWQYPLIQLIRVLFVVEEVYVMRESVYAIMALRELHVKEHNVKMIAVIMDSAYQCSISQIKREIMTHNSIATTKSGMQTRFSDAYVMRVMMDMIVH